MKVILTEEQYRRVLTESVKQDIENKLEKSYNFTKKVINGAQEQLGLSFKFLLTYGAGIGSIIRPITDYLHGEHPSLSETEIQGLVIASIALVFYNTKDYLKIYKEIKEDGLINELGDAVSFTQKLKDRLSRVLDVLGMSIYSGLDIIAYSFLLPILPALLNLLQDPNMDAVALEGLATSSFITISAIVLKKIIEKLSEKISSKKTSDDVDVSQDEYQAPQSDIF